MKLNNPLLNSSWVKEEITREFRKYLETNENKQKRFQNAWDAESSTNREVYSYENTERSQINKLTIFLLLKEVGKNNNK